MTTRGIRNNNPGNIKRLNGDTWQGLSPEQPDPVFLTFISPLWGIRAIAIELKNYQLHHAIRTVRGFIARWAPSSENDTTDYVMLAAARIGVAPDAPYSVLTIPNMVKLVDAIIFHENGVEPYPDDLLKQAANMALT